MRNPNTAWLYLWQYLQKDTDIGQAIEYPHLTTLFIADGAYQGKRIMEDVSEADWYMNEIFPGSRKLLLASQERTLVRIQ